MRHSELIGFLERIPALELPRPSLEQVSTPAEAAATLLETALQRGDIQGRSVADLGSGSGRLALGAAKLGAVQVIAIEVDERHRFVAETEARREGLVVEFLGGDVREFRRSVDTVVMNPPFGAQRRGADRPFWETAFRSSGTAIYSFATSASRSFIPRLAVERAWRVEETRPIPWKLPRTFPHHRKSSVALPVDLWVLRPSNLA